jgi:hypothetical protein
VSVSVPLLAREQVEQLPKRAREVVEYRKSGLSLNHSKRLGSRCMMPLIPITGGQHGRAAIGWGRQDP